MPSPAPASPTPGPAKPRSGAGFSKALAAVPARARLRLWLILLSAFFVASAALDLDDIRPPSGDEIWILSISENLATRGRLGTDLYAGFFNADRSWFIHLPGQHLLHLPALKLAGVGIAQARWVSVIAGVVVIWTAATLAARWYGLAAALLASALLVFWRSGLLEMDLGIPLLSLARTMRYDLSPIAWSWLAILGVDSVLRRPSRAWAMASGAAAAAASLTHFTGAPVILIVAIGWAWSRRRGPVTPGLSVWLAAGFLLLLLPYLAYLVAHRSDAMGQLGWAMSHRLPSGTVPGLIQTIIREPSRYAGLLRPDVGRMLVLLVTGPAVAWLMVRLRRRGEVGDRLLMLALAVPVALLATFEVTKAPLYAETIVVPVCLVVAAAVVDLVRATRALGAPGLAATLLAVGGLGLGLVEGAAAYWYDRATAHRVTPYRRVGDRLAAAVPPGARVAGPERFWWPLKDHPYLALHNLRLQWEVARARRAPQSFPGLVRTHRVGFLVIDDGTIRDLERYPGPLRAEIRMVLDRCAARAGSWTDPTYGGVQLWALSPECPPTLASPPGPGAD